MGSLEKRSRDNMRASVWLMALVISTVLTACGQAAEPGEQSEQPQDVPEKYTEMDKAEAAKRTFGKEDFSLDICELKGWYEDEDCDWFCPAFDPACVPEPIGPDPEGEPTRYPIVLAHGFMSGPSMSSFYGVRDALMEDGHTVYEAEVAPFDAVEVRSDQLAADIHEVLEETGADKVNIIAHSMGGLDARYAISKRGLGDRVASLTSISTPHRGSAMADVALGLVDGNLEKIVNEVARLVGRDVGDDLNEDPDVVAALTDLSVANAPRFNEEVQDDPRVDYHSYAGVSNVFGVKKGKDDEICGDDWIRSTETRDVMTGLLIVVSKVVGGGLNSDPNDGAVKVTSARWGRFEGCVPADHMDEVGTFGDLTPDPYTGFGHVRFYRNIAFDLAARGH